MSIIRQYNSKGLPSKWLLTVVLLLTFFTFSGFGVNGQIRLCKPQTTLVVSYRSEVIKSINYNRLLITPQLKNSTFSAFVDLSDLYSHQIKTRLTILSGYHLQLQTHLFYKVKTTSSATDDDPAVILG